MKAIKFTKSNAVAILEECPQDDIHLMKMFSVFENMPGDWYAVMHNDEGDLDMHTWDELINEYVFVNLRDVDEIATKWVEVTPL